MADKTLTPSSRTSKPQNCDPLAESIDDILVAAQNLMQLIDEDRNNKNDDNDVDGDNIGGKRKRVSFLNEPVADQIQRLPNKEAFGDGVEVSARPKKIKKYRSLAAIYMVTTPINCSSG